MNNLGGTLAYLGVFYLERFIKSDLVAHYKQKRREFFRCKERDDYLHKKYDHGVEFGEINSLIDRNIDSKDNQ